MGPEGVPPEDKVEAKTYNFPNPVNTFDKVLTNQEKRAYTIDGITFDNLFDGARMNEVALKTDSVFNIKILPENKPINSSPWYAFRIITNQRKKIYVKLNYDEFEHRYSPKKSNDLADWQSVDIDNAIFNKDSTTFLFALNIEFDTTYVSAQELFTSNNLNQWISEMGSFSRVNELVIGKSREGRDLVMLDIYEGDKKDKKVIVILCRQHPPEVTGFFAMQAFLDAIINTESDFFDNHRLIVYPMLNPDGVDLGHWRHNTGGIDMNRDWAFYNQPETRQVADHIVRDVIENDSEVLLGLDFHSTFNDVFYTQDKTFLQTPTTEWFRDSWFQRLETRIPGYRVNEVASGLGRPVAKSWFYTQFGAEGITYEIGDNTPRGSIDIIGRVAGEELISVLLENR